MAPWLTLRSRPRQALCLAVVAVAGAAAVRGDGARGAGQARSRISARITIPGHPFRIRAGPRYVWLISRSSAVGCSARRPCSLVRIDARRNRVDRRVALPGNPWDLALTRDSAWVTDSRGRVIRIDARSGRVIARISAQPLYLGGEITAGGGFVWTGNDDERSQGGGTVSKIDPVGNRIVGDPVALDSPQSIGFGASSVWVADHSGWLVKIDPGTLRVVARQRLRFGPHGVVATRRAVFVADAHGGAILEADPQKADIKRTVRLSIGPIYPALGAGSLWSSSAAVWEDPANRDDRVVRIDTGTLRVVETLHVGGNVATVAFGAGSVWAALPKGQVVRIRPGR